MTNEEIINKLRDDKHYYGEFGRQYISNSDIKTILYDPEQFGVPMDICRAPAGALQIS